MRGGSEGATCVNGKQRREEAERLVIDNCLPERIDVENGLWVALLFADISCLSFCHTLIHKHSLYGQAKTHGD